MILRFWHFSTFSLCFIFLCFTGNFLITKLAVNVAILIIFMLGPSMPVDIIFIYGLILTSKAISKFLYLVTIHEPFPCANFTVTDLLPQNCIHHTLVLCPVQFVFFWKCLSLTLHIFNLFLQAPYCLKIFFVRSFKSIEIILKMFSWFIKSAFDGVFDLIGLEFTNSIFLFFSVLE